MIDHPVLDAACKGDPDAIDFCRAMLTIAHAWDDLIDRDKPFDERAVNEAFWLALIELPANAFYRAHQSALAPVMAGAITNWKIATRIERSAEISHSADMVCAFIIRSSYADIFTMVALLIGGPEHAVAAGEELRRVAHEEGFGLYLANVATEKVAREGN